MVPEQMIIHFNDFTRDPETEKMSLIAAAERVIRSGYYVLGPEVKAFEQEWAAWCGASEAVGVANGLDAIEIGLRALGIGPGDEVITTPMTAVATVLGILRAGATPVLADIDPRTGLMSLESAERCLTARTRAVLPVHLYGRISNMAAWTSLCSEAGVALVEDCAQSHGAAESGRIAGTWGVLGAYSFYPTKNLGAVGDAGAIITNRDEVAARARSLRNYGQTTRYIHDSVGSNSRLDELQAAILRARLIHLTQATTRRREISAKYYLGIQNPSVRLLEAPVDPANHVHHLFVVICQERSKLQEHLRSVGVESLIHYPVPVHRQRPFVDITRDVEGLGNADRHAETCLSLPCAPHLTDGECERIISAVNDFQP